jgi:hypothetical protein
MIESAKKWRRQNATKGMCYSRRRRVLVLAEATRRRLFDRAVSDRALVTGYLFPFPAVGTIVPDGADYTFVPAA